MNSCPRGKGGNRRTRLNDFRVMAEDTAHVPAPKEDGPSTCVVPSPPGASRLSPTQRTMATDDNAGIAKTKSAGYRFRLVNLHGGGIGNESIMNDLNPE